MNYFNRLTGFIEIYPQDTKFTSDEPFTKYSVINESPVISQYANGASKSIIKKIEYLNSVKIEDSFKRLTDTCEIVLPRIDSWINEDNSKTNTYNLFDPQNISNSELMSEGNLVRVFIGYDYDERLMFQGYISEVSNTIPVTVKLEDSMYLLKKKFVNGIYTHPDSTTDNPKDVRLSDFLYDLIDGTEVELHPTTIDVAPEITFGKYFQAKQSTSARVLKDIKDRGLSVFFEDGKLIIGRTYFDSSLTPHISTASNKDYEPPVINNEVNVPYGSNNLKTTTMNKKRNMVTVQKFISSSRILQLNVALDPREREDKFIAVAIHDSANRDDEEAKNKLTNWLIKNYGSKIDTDGYSQITATMDESIEKIDLLNLDDYKEVVNKMLNYGKDMFWKYYDSGLSGDITTFGDFNLKSAQSIVYIDPRNPESNGEYLITDVSTTWGYNTGYRQKLKIGIKIKDFIYDSDGAIIQGQGILGESSLGVENIV